MSTTTTYDVLLSQLEGARRAPVRPGKTIRAHRARCPAHDSRSLSLSIAETVEGGVLINCFGGCSAAEVVSAVGLTLSDLFPPHNENGGAGSSNGGPSTWAAAAAAADAISDQVLDFLCGVPDADLALIRTTAEFRKLARAAMRSAAQKGEGI